MLRIKEDVDLDAALPKYGFVHKTGRNELYFNIEWDCWVAPIQEHLSHVVCMVSSRKRSIFVYSDYVSSFVSESVISEYKLIKEMISDGIIE